MRYKYLSIPVYVIIPPEIAPTTAPINNPHAPKNCPIYEPIATPPALPTTDKAFAAIFIPDY